MSVLPNYQKMGIGSKLIEYGIKAAKKPDMILLSYWVTRTITYPENHRYNFFF
jgi:GNAT superfamily N-acetyltransferase